VVTCDLDTDSNSTKILGKIGWIINKLFKHQGILHSPYLWAVVGILGYLCIGWEWFGLIIPQYIHLVMDWIF
jgi:uncharacterized metal-binding protein